MQIPQHLVTLAEWIAAPDYTPAFVVGSKTFETCGYCGGVDGVPDEHTASHRTMT